MEKVLKIEVDNKEFCKGTLGWLCENADRLRIGTTTNNNQGAWLENSDGETIVTLAVRSFLHDDGKVERMINNDGCCDELNACAHNCSAKCWAKIEDIQDEVVDIMDAVWESESGGRNLRLGWEEVNDEENM